jgi:peptide chain release factor 1
MIGKLQEILERFENLESAYNDPEIVTDPREMQRVGKQRAELEPVVGVIKDYFKARGSLSESEELLADPEMRDLAQEEIEHLKQVIPSIEQKLKLMLIPTDPNDEKSVIIEIRPAAGGSEAALFANDLFRMYLRYAERRRWKAEVVDHEEDGLGGAAICVFKIDAVGAYSQLKHESGVHRVQRVPITESQGRIHTSTATVAVLPEAEAVDVDIKDEDLEVSTFRSSSAGGQHMQKNETAIRIVHKPSNLAVTCQDERSQQQNKLKAMEVLRAKLYQLELERQEAERGKTRKGQIKTGDRSEKIRTYNFPDSRITDHRIGFQMHNMQGFLDGDIQPMLDALSADEQARRLAESES